MIYSFIPHFKLIKQSMQFQSTPPPPPPPFPNLLKPRLRLFETKEFLYFNIIFIFFYQIYIYIYKNTLIVAFFTQT